MNNYLEWLITEHKFGNIKLALFLIGVVQCIYFTKPLYEEYLYGMPLSILILGYIAMYGFTIGIALQPYTIYRRLNVKKD